MVFIRFWCGFEMFWSSLNAVWFYCDLIWVWYCKAQGPNTINWLINRNFINNFFYTYSQVIRFLKKNQKKKTPHGPDMEKPGDPNPCKGNLQGKPIIVWNISVLLDYDIVSLYGANKILLKNLLKLLTGKKKKKKKGPKERVSAGLTCLISSSLTIKVSQLEILCSSLAMEVKIHMENHNFIVIIDYVYFPIPKCNSTNSELDDTGQLYQLNPFQTSYLFHHSNWELKDFFCHFRQIRLINKC